ncbi:hypothetical protein Taro_026621 [Colocasia esculenta]|uniref:Uncharacterized protein n=1 Tax=Colocasia esculenta TaxID=4460 RepID=A0A843VRU3_COLES|nr:hypothetical protein [Colocasia esculenta]
MERASLHLVLILLASSLIATLTAVPLPRDQRLFHGLQVPPSLGGVHLDISKEGLLDELIVRGRMDLANNDYTGAGANGKHTPKPPA